MNDWTHAQYLDELRHQEEVIDLLRQAEEAGTPQTVLEQLAHECGVGKMYQSTNHDRNPT